MTYYSNGGAATFIKTDISGNVYTAGSTGYMDGPFYTFLQKYSPSGTQLFSVSVDTPCQMSSVYKDNSDNIYVDGTNNVWSAPMATVAKFGPTGAELWRITEIVSANDANRNMTGDINGNPCLIRNRGGINQFVKYNSSGVQQLLINITDTINPYSISIDNQNNFIINGDAYLTGNVYSIITIKYSSSGVKQWKSIFVPPGGPQYSYSPLGRLQNSTESNIGIGNSGNIYIMASLAFQPNTADYAIIKYSSSGQQEWAAHYNRNQYDYAYGMVMDALENCYVTGGSGTVKFDSSGSVLWADTASNMSSIALDKYENVFCTGGVGNPSMMRTIKINSAGNFAWSINHWTGNPYSDYSDAIDVDTSGNVFIAGLVGHTPIQGFLGSAATIKYSQLDGIKNIENTVPAHFSLSQNYPNPFNPSTKIKLDIAPPLNLPLSGGDVHARAGAVGVKLVVYDVLGREVATLVNQQLQPGSYEVNWDASNYPSGIYFYKINAGDFVETKKMILIK